tara:strand:- start:4448 stop:5116 length:669 start_codon:yes stop_codon:yes gene_type:complete
MPTPPTNHTHWPSGTTPILAENGIRFSVSESGFDTINMKYYARTDTPITYAKTNFDVGISVGTVLSVAYANMFFNGVSINQDGSNIYSFDVQAAGLLNESQPVKRTVSSKIQSYKTGLGTVPGSSPAIVGEIQGQYINLSCTFHQVTTALPNTATRPENAVALGTLPTPPTNPFTSLPTTPIYNYPYGWIQDGLEIETINGASATIYLVKQSMVYIYPYMPG